MSTAPLKKIIDEPTPVRRLARRVFLAFLLTFIAARIFVILIMTRRIPNMFLHARGTHVHHLNYGIFILSAVGAILVFVTRPSDKLRKLCAWLYGVGMGTPRPDKSQQALTTTKIFELRFRPTKARRGRSFALRLSIAVRAYSRACAKFAL